MTTPNPSAAVAVPAQPKPPVPLAGPIADLDSAFRYASALAQASIVPDDLRGKPSNVLMIILYGQQLNVPPPVAIQTITVIKGRPVIAGRLLLAKVREAGHRSSITDHTDRACTVTITRGDTGETHTEKFTLEDAVASKLVAVKDGKPFARSKNGEALPWESFTRRMLMWRAVGYCVDAICPEIRMGFAIEGELDHLEPERPNLAQVAAERTDRPAEPAPPAAAPTDAEVAEQVAAIADEHQQQAVPLAELPHDDPAMVADLLAAHEAEQAGDPR